MCVELLSGRKIFRSHVLKPDLSTTKGSPPLDYHTMSPQGHSLMSDEALFALNGENSFTLAADGMIRSFATSREAELEGLSKAKVFEVVDRSSVPRGTRIYGTRRVDSIKKLDDGSVK